MIARCCRLSRTIKSYSVRRFLSNDIIAAAQSLPTLYPKQLRDIVDIDRLLEEHPLHPTAGNEQQFQKSLESIQRIWLGYNHLTENEDKAVQAICGMLSSEHYKTMIERATTCPLSLIPIFKPNKDSANVASSVPPHMMLLSQFQKTTDGTKTDSRTGEAQGGPQRTFLLTFLEDFQRNQGAARPWCTVTLYDLRNEINLVGKSKVEALAEHVPVLIRAEFLAPLVSRQEAGTIMGLLLPSLYVSDAALFRHVSCLNLLPGSFKYEEYVKDVHQRTSPAL